MTKVAVVTTFAKDHIDLYGKRFVDSFKTNCNYSFYVYAEDFNAKDIDNTVIDFYAAIPEHKKFKETIEQKLVLATRKEQNRLRKALRWSYKSFVIINALETIDADYIVWIDADVVTVNPIPNDLIEQLCGSHLMMCYPQKLDDGLHIESGFVIFNKRHQQIQQQLLKIKKPWDGYWLAHLISTNQSIRKNTREVSAPFGNIKQYFKHQVGKRKFDSTGLNKFSGRKETD